jgi:hypothetical protein
MGVETLDKDVTDGVGDGEEDPRGVFLDPDGADGVKKVVRET